MDLVDLKEEIDKFNRETLPKLEEIVFGFTDRLSMILDKINGLSIIFKLGDKDK
jgi:hypothetical protein